MSSSDQSETSQADLKRWIDGVLRTPRNQRRPHERVDDPGHPRRLILNLAHGAVNLEGVPEGWEVELSWRHERSGPSQLTVTSSAAPSRLLITAWPSLKTVDLTPDRMKTWPGTVELDLLSSASPVTLQVGNVIVSEVLVNMGDLSMPRAPAPLRIGLRSASISGLTGKPNGIVVAGAVQLPSGFQTTKTAVHGEFSLQMLKQENPYEQAREPKPIRLGAVEGVGGESIKIEVGALVTCVTFPAGSVIDVAESSSLEVTGETADIRAQGRGSIRLANCKRAIFDGDLALSLKPGDSIELASGRIASLNIEDATITGAEENPLAARRILNAEGAELDSVDLTQLTSISSISRLRAAHRVVPSLPSKFKELTAIAEGKPPGMPEQARQVFWAQLSDLVAEKKARGAVQAELRFISAHARLMAAPKWSREKAWLWLYKAVGYGERIWRPLFLYILASMLVFTLVVSRTAGLEPVQDGSPMVNGLPLRLMWDLFVLPLSFFRFAGESVIQGGLFADVLTLILRVGGILMVFFALAAIRRLTKAE